MFEFGASTWRPNVRDQSEKTFWISDFFQYDSRVSKCKCPVIHIYRLLKVDPLSGWSGTFSRHVEAPNLNIENISQAKRSVHKNIKNSK